MSTEIVRATQAAPPAVARGGALSLAQMSAQEAWRFAEALSGAALLPGEYRGNPGSVLWAMEYGRALGLDVVTTITTIHVIKGKPTQSADLMLSRAREAGHRVRVKSDRERCVVSIVRHDDPDDENVIEWTLDDARTALLYPGKPDSNWAKYPRAMLRARAISECVRAACPEVLHGAIYTAEELGARVDDAGLPVEAEVQQLRRVQGDEPDQWAAPSPSAPVQQTPPEVVARAVADVPPESLTPSGRDYLHEALAAPDAATVRLIWQDARTEGARQEYLDQIAEVGRAKATPDWHAGKPTPAFDGSDGRVVTGQVVSAEEQAEAAERELRAFAEQVGLPGIDADFEAAKGLPLTQATADQISGFLGELRGTAA